MIKLINVFLSWCFFYEDFSFYHFVRRNEKMSISSTSSMDDVFEQELNTVALDLSLKIIQDSIEELQTEISQIDSVEKAAMNLLDDIIPTGECQISSTLNLFLSCGRNQGRKRSKSRPKRNGPKLVERQRPVC